MASQAFLKNSRPSYLLHIIIFFNPNPRLSQAKVPQDSLRVPLLYIITAYDIPNNRETLTATFADDTTVLTIPHNPRYMESFTTYTKLLFPQAGTELYWMTCGPHVKMKRTTFNKRIKLLYRKILDRKYVHIQIYLSPYLYTTNIFIDHQKRNAQTTNLSKQNFKINYRRFLVCK